MFYVFDRMCINIDILMVVVILLENGKYVSYSVSFILKVWYVLFLKLKLRNVLEEMF